MDVHCGYGVWSLASTLVGLSIWARARSWGGLTFDLAYLEGAVSAPQHAIVIQTLLIACVLQTY